ncbi:MAG: hypothetical protein HY840_02340 [Bacteroidetes bacterium]|nr:hypothetical protein [Bacteroidota bacterium]
MKLETSNNHTPQQTCHLEQFDWLTVSPAERRMVVHTHTHTQKTLNNQFF